MCRATLLKRKGPGLMSLSGVALLYDGVVNRLDGAQLARVFPELISLERGFLSLVASACRADVENVLVGSTGSLVQWFSAVLVPTLVTSLGCLHGQGILSAVSGL